MWDDDISPIPYWCECRSRQIQNTHFLWHPGSLLGFAGSAAGKDCRPLTGNNHRTIGVTLHQLVCSTSIYGTLNTRRTWTITKWTMCASMGSFLLSKPCYVAGGVGGVRSQEVDANTLKKVRWYNTNIFHRIYLDEKGSYKGGGGETERRKIGSWQREREEDEEGRRESSNDGSDQRTTCQTPGVISCFIEDFYGILAAWLTSQREGKPEGEREKSSLPSSLPFSSPSNPLPSAVFCEAKHSKCNW